MSRFSTYQKIKDLIIKREIKDAITETEISKLLNISRTPVREALTLLMHEGWIISKSERVKVVSDVSFRELKHIYQIRYDMELMALKLAWPRIDKGYLAKFVQNIVNHDNADNFHEMHKLDRLFHQKVYMSTDNSLLISVLTHINDRLSLLRDEKMDYFVKESNLEHLEIARAIIDDDFEKAASSLESHINNSYKRLVDTL